jgi:glycosyltransferase involved in cell wall biosynthesis
VSCYDWSNVGNPLFEALSAGLPVVTLANGGTSQWVTHRLNGLLCQAESDRIPEEVARALCDLQHQPRMLDDLSKGALETARNRVWSWKERMRHEIDRVSEVMGRLRKRH